MAEKRSNRDSKPKDDRRVMVSAAIKASAEIGQLVKKHDWQTDGAYVRELMSHVLEICERYGLLPTLSHMAYALGVPKDVMDDVRTGFIHANPDVVGCLTEWYQLCESVTLSTTLSGAVNNIAGIFTLKSQYGYKEEPREVVVTHNKLLGERKDPKQIAERYRDATVVDAVETRAIEEKVADEYDF